MLDRAEFGLNLLKFRAVLRPTAYARSLPRGWHEASLDLQLLSVAPDSYGGRALEISDTPGYRAQAVRFSSVPDASLTVRNLHDVEFGPFRTKLPLTAHLGLVDASGRLLAYGWPEGDRLQKVPAAIVFGLGAIELRLA